MGRDYCACIAVRQTSNKTFCLTHITLGPLLVEEIGQCVFYLFIPDRERRKPMKVRQDQI
jgi:hypothetical protein